MNKYTRSYPHIKSEEKLSPYEIMPRLTITIALVLAIGMFLLLNAKW
jgi:hypothetical protein